MQEIQLKGTPYKYIRGREFVVFSNGVTMSMDEFKLFHSKGILAKKVATLAKVPKRLSDYHVALEKGILKQKFVPARIKKKRTTKKPEEQAPKNRVAAIKKKLVATNKSQVIFFCMLIIAIGSALMSIYHAGAFLYNGGKPLIISVITAILLVMFASTGFTAARYFADQRGMARVFAVPFVLITSTLICYIAFSTTSVSYEQFTKEQSTKVASVRKEIGKLELYKETKQSITETVRYIRRLERTNMKDKTKWAFARHQRMLAAERKKLSNLRDRAYKLKEQSGGGSIAEKQEEISSVYDFLMTLFGVNAKILKFVIYVIPAIFYDIVAPFGFTIVFFMVDSNREEEECNAET